MGTEKGGKWWKDLSPSSLNWEYLPRDPLPQNGQLRKCFPQGQPPRHTEVAVTVVHGGQTTSQPVDRAWQCAHVTTGFAGMQAARVRVSWRLCPDSKDAKQGTVASDSLQEGLGWPLDDVGKVKPKLQWWPWDGNARAVRCSPRCRQRVRTAKEKGYVCVL